MKLPSAKVLKEGLEQAGEIGQSATARYGHTHSSTDLDIMSLADSAVGRLNRALARVTRGSSEVG